MSKYSIVTDSHYRQFLKEEGYGFIGQIEHHRVGMQTVTSVKPMNKGCDLTTEERMEAYRQASPNPNAGRRR